jgi:hypothetical protein
MKIRTFIITAATAVLLAFSGSALTAPKLCDDGTRPPCDTNGGGGSEPPDLGDLFILYRDANGVPILTADDCQQPLAAPGVTLPAVETIPECIPPSATESCVIPVDPATCAVAVGYEAYTQEVDFGRTSVVRSPVSVLEQQLDDVVVNLSTADCISLDPAGRLVTSTVIPSTEEGVPDEVLSGAIDSPLQNLAIYWQLMQTGYLGAAAAPLALPDDNFLNTAARGVGAASDKTGKVGVDMVVYLNQILGLANENVQTVLPKTCINVREEVNGAVQTVRKCFLNYGAVPPDSLPYAYERTANFGSLPAPAYIPDSEPMDGWFEYLALWEEGAPNLFYIKQGPILDPVFGADPGFPDGNIGGFAQASDDARAVIDFMHSNPLPLGYETAVPCAAIPGGDTTYDVSISNVSGLQVPVQMVDGTEGREFTVAVANAGPDAASGTVTVTAVAANGGTIVGSPWTFTFTALAAGASESFVQPFYVELGEQTTIAWTATVSAPNDVLLSNNTVTATTSVKVTGGGGSSGGQHGRP